MFAEPGKPSWLFDNSRKRVCYIENIINILWLEYYHSLQTHFIDFGQFSRIGSKILSSENHSQPIIASKSQNHYWFWKFWIVNENYSVYRLITRSFWLQVNTYEITVTPVQVCVITSCWGTWMLNDLFKMFNICRK